MTTNKGACATFRDAMGRARTRVPAMALLLAAATFLQPACKKSQETPADNARLPPGTAAAPEVEAVSDLVRNVQGRWVREDGGYILEIREARAGGHLEALYFNPRPIHVSRAAWMERADTLQVFVELTDAGYPGATYMLRHDRERNRLIGEYTQPAMNQSFQVEFMPEHR